MGIHNTKEVEYIGSIDELYTDIEKIQNAIFRNFQLIVAQKRLLYDKSCDLKFYPVKNRCNWASKRGIEKYVHHRWKSPNFISLP
jgi:hypothetical protein